MSGSLRGITVDSTFAIHRAEVSDATPHQITTAVAKKVKDFVSYLEPLDDAFFATHGDQCFLWYARLTRASGPNLVIHCNSPDNLTHIITKDCDPGLTVPATTTDNRCKADLCLTVEGSTVFFDWGDKDNLVFGASKDFPSRFSTGLDVNNITGIHRVIDRYGCFNSHLNTTRPHSFSDYISMEMHELKLDKGVLSPTGNNILPYSEKKSIDFVIDSSPGEKYYGFTIHNISKIDLYVYLFCFEASTLEIDMFTLHVLITHWSSSSCNRRFVLSANAGNNQERGKVDPNLEMGSAVLTLGYGSGGMNPIQFTVPGDQDVDVSFFKIFAMTHAVDLGSISQSSPFTPKFTEANKRGC